METHNLQLVVPWAEVKEKLKENDLEFTDEDLVHHPGRENEILKRLQKK